MKQTNAKQCMFILWYVNWPHISVLGTQRGIPLTDTMSTPFCSTSKVGPSFSVLRSRHRGLQSPCWVTMATFTGKRARREWLSPSHQCLWMSFLANGLGYLRWPTSIINSLLPKSTECYWDVNLILFPINSEINVNVAPPMGWLCYFSLMAV